MEIILKRKYTDMIYKIEIEDGRVCFYHRPECCKKFDMITGLPKEVILAAARMCEETEAQNRLNPLKEKQ